MRAVSLLGLILAIGPAVTAHGAGTSVRREELAHSIRVRASAVREHAADPAPAPAPSRPWIGARVLARLVRGPAPAAPAPSTFPARVLDGSVDRVLAGWGATRTREKEAFYRAPRRPMPARVLRADTESSLGARTALPSLGPRTPAILVDQRGRKLNRMRRAWADLRDKDSMAPGAQPLGARILRIQKRILDHVELVDFADDTREHPVMRFAATHAANGTRVSLEDYLRMGYVTPRELAILTQIALQDLGFDARLAVATSVGSGPWPTDPERPRSDLISVINEGGKRAFANYQMPHLQGNPIGKMYGDDQAQFSGTGRPTLWRTTVDTSGITFDHAPGPQGRPAKLPAVRSSRPPGHKDVAFAHHALGFHNDLDTEMPGHNTGRPLR